MRLPAGETHEVAPPLNRSRAGGGQTDGGSTIHLPHLWRALRRGWWWIAGVPAALIILTGVWTWLQQPEFEGAASLTIETEAPEGGLLAQQVAVFAGLGGGRGSIETELQLLESRQVAEAVVDSLFLQVRVVKPQEPRETLFAEVAVLRDAFEGTIDLVRRADGRYRVAVEAPEAYRPLIATAPIDVGLDEAFEVGGVRLRLNPGIEEPAERIELQVLSFRSAVESFRNRLNVQRAGGSVVEVSYRHSDPVLAASATNAAVDRFIDYRRETSRDEARGAIGFLREQVADYEVELREAEQRLREFREGQMVISPEAAAVQQANRLATLEAGLADLRAERQVLTALMEAARAAPEGTARASAYRRLATFPEFFRSIAVQDILSALVELENERAEVMVLRTAENADVQAFTRRIEELEAQLYATAENYLVSLDAQLAAGGDLLAESRGRAAELPAVEAQFLQISREMELLEQIYTLLQMRLKEQEVTEADVRSDIRLVDAALVPLAPVSPKPKLNLLLALAGGLVLGVGIALGRAILDRGMYSREVALEAARGLPVLSSVGSARSSIRARLASRQSGGRDASRAVGALQAAPVDVDGYADLRIRLDTFTVPAPRSIVITSPNAGDGKSTVAYNLAAAYVRQGRRTLLVEGDLRRPMLARHLAVESEESGLARLLHGSEQLAGLVQRHRLSGGSEALDVLVAGSLPRGVDSLLEAEAISRFMDQARMAYDVVVVDTPPLDAVADALLFARFADGVVIVTRAGTTDRAALESAVAELDAVHAHVLGLVLNGFSNRSGERYSST